MPLPTTTVDPNDCAQVVTKVLAITKQNIDALFRDGFAEANPNLVSQAFQATMNLWTQMVALADRRSREGRDTEPK